MSCFHGSKIAGSQQSFLTETACALLSDGRKVWATSLFLSAIMHKFVHVNFFCHICRTMVCGDPEILLSWRCGVNNFSSLVFLD